MTVRPDEGLTGKFNRQGRVGARWRFGRSDGSSDGIREENMLGQWGRAKAMVAMCVTAGKGSDGESDGGRRSSREGDKRTASVAMSAAAGSSDG